MSNFNADIFKQASDEVNDKGIGSRIWHSGSLHSFRSATSSKGSAASKGLSVLKSVGSSCFKSGAGADRRQPGQRHCGQD